LIYNLLEGDLCVLAALEDRLCTVVRGKTSILLDNCVGDVDTVAYQTLKDTLQDTEYLRQLTSSNIIQAVFVFPIGENIVILANDDTESRSSEKVLSKGTLMVAVAAALVSIILASFFLFGLFRKTDSYSVSHNNGLNSRRLYFYQMKRNQYFEHLEDEPSLSPGWMTKLEKGTALKTPSTTWSVSDLTSDTQSIKETLPMERIDEECAFEIYEEANSHEVASPKEVSGKPALTNHFLFMRKWNDASCGSEIASYPDESTTMVNPQSTDDKSQASHTLDISEVYRFREFMLPSNPTYTSHIDQYDALPDYCAEGSRFVLDSDSSSSSTCQESCKSKASDKDDMQNYFDNDQEIPSTPEQGRFSKAIFSSQLVGIAGLVQENKQERKLKCTQTIVFEHALVVWAQLLLAKLVKFKNQRLLNCAGYNIPEPVSPKVK
jgi:hypothetical protein